MSTYRGGYREALPRHKRPPDPASGRRSELRRGRATPLCDEASKVIRC